MKSHPILFSAPMVRALLDGSKTQTRRLLKIQPEGCEWQCGAYSPTVIDKHGDDCAGAEIFGAYTTDGEWTQPCPHGQVGDQLWVRETWMYGQGSMPIYRANTPNAPEGQKWRPSIFMPRAASRITLEITGVRVERLQDMTEDDAKAEGTTEFIRDGFVKATKGKVWSEAVRLDPAAGPFKGAYACLWESINGAGTWALNPWVWVLEFKEAPPQQAAWPKPY